MSDLNNLIQIPESEQDLFNEMVVVYRKKYIRTSTELVNEMFEEQKFSKDFSDKNISEIIETARETV